MSTDIPPEKFTLNKLDLQGNWKAYSKSIIGLGHALMDNAQRLVEWDYFACCDSDGTTNMRFHRYQSLLVEQCVGELRSILWKFDGVERVVLANACYFQFLLNVEAARALKNINFDFSKLCLPIPSGAITSDEVETKNIIQWPIHSDVIEDVENHCIERRNSSMSGSGLRYTYVTIKRIGAVTPNELVKWLNSDYWIEYSGKEISRPEEDGLVFGDDCYGQEFCAGRIDEPEMILSSLKGMTPSEKFQECL